MWVKPWVSLQYGKRKSWKTLHAPVTKASETKLGKARSDKVITCWEQPRRHLVGAGGGKKSLSVSIPCPESSRNSYEGMRENQKRRLGREGAGS